MVALQQVLCLEEVVRTKSFRSAALALHMSQPAVSGHIARLERELHLKLLERTPSGSVLTPAGTRILPYLRAFAESAEVIRRASEFILRKEHRTVTLLSNSHGARRVYPEVIAMLHGEFDNLTVRCTSADDAQICDALRSGEANLGIMTCLGDQRERPDIATTELLDIGPIGICAPVGDALLESVEGPIDPMRLEGKSLILVAQGTATHIVEQLFPPPIRGSVAVVDDPETATQLVEAGVGYAVVAGWTDCVRSARLDWRGLLDAPRATLHLARSRTTELSPPAALLSEHLVAWGQTAAKAFHYDLGSGRMEQIDGLKTPA